MKSLHIFTRGRHTDSHGQVLNVSEQDLRACADAYDPALHEAPDSDRSPDYRCARLRLDQTAVGART